MTERWCVHDEEWEHCHPAIQETAAAVPAPARRPGSSPSPSPLRQLPYRCPRCGELVSDIQPSLDPNHVIARCRNHVGSVVPVRASSKDDALRIVEQARLDYLERIGEKP